MKAFKTFFNGLITENPTFVQALGLCPTLAVSSSLKNSLGMGLAATFVLACSNVIISLIKDVIPSKVRIPAYVVVIAAFVTIVDMAMHAYVPTIHKSLGLFIPLIVVNCIILGRAEAFANKNNMFLSLIDGIGMGLGFTLGLSVLGIIREVLGAGQILGHNVLWSDYKPMLAAILAPGAFFTIGLLLGLMALIRKR